MTHQFSPTALCGWARRLVSSALLVCAAGVFAQVPPNLPPRIGASPPPATTAGSVAHTLYLSVPTSQDMPDLKGPNPGSRIENWIRSEVLKKGKLFQDNARADRQAREAMSANSAGGPPEVRLMLLDRIGREKTVAGDYAAGLESFQQGVTVAREAGEAQTEGLADMLNNSGVVRAARGDYVGALASLGESLELYKSLRVPRTAQGSPSDAARPAADRSEKTASGRALLGQEMALLNLGALHAYMGQYADAYTRYNQALTLYPNTPAPTGASAILRGLSRVAQQLNRVDESRRYGEKAVQAGLSAFEADTPGIAQRSIVLGGGASASRPTAPGPAPMAQLPPGFGPAMALPPTGTKPATGDVVNPVLGELRKVEQAAAAAEATGQIEAAVAAWRKAAVMAEYIGSPDGVRNALAQLQRLHALNKQPAMAIFYGKQAINEIQRQQGRVATMDRDARRALANRTRAVSESLIVALLKESRLAEAEQALWLQRTGASAGLEGRANKMPFSEAESALLQRDQGLATRWRLQMESSAELDRSSMSITPAKPGETLEAMRKTRFDGVEKELDWLEAQAANPALSQMLPMIIGPQLVRLVSQFGKTPCDPPVVDARVRALEARVSRLRAKHAPPSSNAAMVVDAGLSAQKDSSYRGLGLSQDPMVGERLKCAELTRLAIEQELAKPDQSLAQKLQAGAPRFGAAEDAALEAGRRALKAPAGAVALHYLVSEKSLHLLLVTATERTPLEVPVDRVSLDDLVIKYRKALQDRLRSPVETAQSLHRLLIGPIQPQLDRAQARTIVLALDGSLRYMPFGALHDGQRWLVEKYALAVDTPGAARTAARGEWRMAGFGSTVGGAGLEPLPGVADELQGLVGPAGSSARGLMPGILQLDAAFTAEALRTALQARYEVVHIASHFHFVQGRADESYLLLGDGTKLQLPELRRTYRFDGVELVTLSACDTGLDTVDSYGQEFEGLAAILRQQGAAAVLATLWPVADASTGRFMRGFYAKQGTTRLSRADALRRAQLEFIGKSPATPGVPARTRGGDLESVNVPAAAVLAVGDGGTSHPFYWAPFVLSGDWR